MSHVLVSDVLALHRNSKDELSVMQNCLGTLQTPKPEKPIGVPLATLFQSLAISCPDGESNPTPTQCATHLELLEVFLQLRLDVLNSKELDGSFGLQENPRTVYRKTRVGYNRRKPKFAYTPVTLKDTTWQARRREKWPYFLSIAVERFQVWVAKAEEALTESEKTEEGLVLPLRCLPPLDVLMVWHAFLLNPRDFAAYCAKEKLARIRQVPFPWRHIHSAINMEILMYTLPPAAEEWLKSTADLHPDLFSYLCSPKTCSAETATLYEYGVSTTPSTSSNELEQLVHEDASRTTDTLCFLRAYTYLSKAFWLSAPSQCHPEHQRMVANVQRQASFVDKMHAHLWIRSPAVAGTLRRAVARYGHFVELFVSYPGRMLVPMLDIDLVWHTHQCDASRYERTMREKTGRFIDHDDKLGSGVLLGRLEETKGLFLVRFGTAYEVCLCWDCQALLECLEESEGESEKDPQVGFDMEAMVRRVRESVEYCRRVELARRGAHPIRPGR